MNNLLDYEDLFSLDPFSLSALEKKELHSVWLNALTKHHKELCPEYNRICAVLGDAAPLPVRLFKDLDLKSFEGNAVKTMKSSGTTGRQSRIYLDRDNAARQSKALVRIVSSFTGSAKRLPMLIIDSRSTASGRLEFSARTAGIRGFSMLGRDVTYALNDDLSLDWETVNNFALRHKGETVLLFGFTFVVWAQAVLKAKERGLSVEMKGLLVHGGGWKKLADQAVSRSSFAKGVSQVFGSEMRSCDYYGMVEQTGSICMECEYGNLHASVLSQINIVDPNTIRSVPFGEEGLIVSTSLLPTSYPGHILLTEDVGRLLGEDDCPCGRKGRYFEVLGRQRGAEIRGCSDAYGS